MTPRRMFEILCRTGQLAVNLERVEGSYILQVPALVLYSTVPGEGIGRLHTAGTGLCAV